MSTTSSPGTLPDPPSFVLMPSEVSTRVGFFDQFAGWAAVIASRAPFFAFCLLLVLVWLVQGLVTIIVTRSFSAFLDSQYQLEINTTTTIITFLLVALLQNSEAVRGAGRAQAQGLHLQGLSTR